LKPGLPTVGNDRIEVPVAVTAWVMGRRARSGLIAAAPALLHCREPTRQLAGPTITGSRAQTFS